MKTANFADEDNDYADIRPASLFDKTFVILAFMMSLFSGIATYYGLSYDLPKIASLGLAIGIGIGLLAVNLHMRASKLRGESLSGSLVVFLMLLFISFGSNTNAVYTFYLQKDIVEDTQLNAWNNFDSGTTLFLQELDNSPILEEGLSLKRRLDPAVETFIRQLCDKNNPGLGKQATIHLQEVESLLGIVLTRLKEPKDSSAEYFKNYCEQYRTYINSVFSDKYSTQESEELVNIKNQIYRERSYFETALDKNDWNKKYAEEMKRKLETLRQRTQALLKKDIFVADINAEADETGSLEYTFRNFLNGIKPVAIFVSVLISLLIDLLAPFITIFMYKEDEGFE